MPRISKKSAPVAIKSVRRKPGPEPKIKQEEIAVDQKCDNEAAAAPALDQEMTNFGQCLAQAIADFTSPAVPDFTDIEVIDLRGVNIFGRFHVANMLQNAGYVFGHAPELPATDYVNLWAYSETLRLSHSNKLLFQASWDDSKSSPAIVKLLSASSDVNVVLSDPLPNTVMIDGEVFVRQQ